MNVEVGCLPGLGHDTAQGAGRVASPAVRVSPRGMMTRSGAGTEIAMTNPEQRRLRRSVALHGFAVAVWAMLALSGASVAAPGLYGLAVPFMVAGIAGAVGAAVIAVSVWRLQRGEAGGDVRDGAGVRMDSVQGGAAAAKRTGATQRTMRLAMAAAAVVVLVAGVLLAPQGMDRGFAISVAAGLAVALALFALLAGDRRRTAERPRSARGPH